MIHCMATSIPFLFFILRSSLASWDGCGVSQKIADISSSAAASRLASGVALDDLATVKWRCGDICISVFAECRCGGQVFNFEDQMWCCQESSCRKGQHNEVLGRKIGALCPGKALHLTQARVAKLARVHWFFIVFFGDQIFLLWLYSNCPYSIYCLSWNEYVLIFLNNSFTAK